VFRFSTKKKRRFKILGAKREHETLFCTEDSQILDDTLKNLSFLGRPGSWDLSTTDVKYTVFYCKGNSGTCQIVTLRTGLRKRAALDKVACSGA